MISNCKKYAWSNENGSRVAGTMSDSICAIPQLNVLEMKAADLIELIPLQTASANPHLEEALTKSFDHFASRAANNLQGSQALALW